MEEFVQGHSHRVQPCYSEKQYHKPNIEICYELARLQSLIIDKHLESCKHVWFNYCMYSDKRRILRESIVIMNHISDYTCTTNYHK